MKYHFSISAENGKEVDKLPSKHPIRDEAKNKGLASLKKGQQITGTVISVNNGITIDFSGQQVTTSNHVLNNVKPGDVKTFEVVKTNNNEIELRVLEDNSAALLKTIKAMNVKNSDWESILAKKEDEAKKSEQDEKYKETKTKLEKIGSKLTNQDCGQLEKEGFAVEGFTVDGLYEALNRIKASETGISNNNGRKMTSFDKDTLDERLRNENLPVTDDNISKLSKALQLSGSVTNMDDKAMQYLISTGAQPTLQNIYKACYSSAIQSGESLSEITWNQLADQVNGVIDSAGFEVNAENRSDARWLLENNLPLTEETFAYRKELESLKTDSPDDILNRVLDGMRKGISPEEVSLISPDSSSAQRVISNINSISDEAVSQAIREGDGLTINKLYTIQEKIAQSNVNQTNGGSEVNQEKLDSKEADAEAVDENKEAAVTKDDQYEELKAKRQLEEIRLKMTLEAAGRLKEKGFSIDTEELSKVVEELRKLEDNYYRDRLREADADISDQSVQILKDTTESIEKLKFIPCNVLGTTLTTGSSETITGLLTEGSKLQAEYEKAGTAYESLMTVPNSEYGDSLKKAFDNADALLNQMNLLDTEQNRRAIRILGYNQMEITQDNINKVKAYDRQVTDMMNNLNPAVTVRMIKEGINPLNMPISDLNDKIDRIKEQGISSEDKYSTYLRNLEKQDGITSEERKAYIGIYRLLYNIDKSDGAAVGSVVNSGREVTLGNLLTAIQTSRKGSLDAVINDEFGTLQNISHSKETIAEQLDSFNGRNEQEYQEQSHHNGQKEGQSADDAVKAQTEYLNRILKQMKEEMTPQKLMEAGSNQLLTEVSQSQMTVATALSSDRSIWEHVKGVPVEKFLEQLQNAQDNSVDDEVYRNKAQELRELMKNPEQSIRFLNDYKLPSTPMNIMLANNVLSNGESVIKKLIKQKNENNIESSENNLKEINELSDKLVDKSSMQEIYEKLETDTKETLNQAFSQEIIDSRRLAELKSMNQQMSFIKKLADKEFYQIPIETDKGIINMNLTIVRGTQTSGRLSVNVVSNQLGNIKAEFSLKDQVLKGFFSSDNQSGLEQLHKNIGAIENAADENNVTIKQMDFGVQTRENDSYTYQNSGDTASDTTSSGETERTLYRIAKAIIQTVRMAENSITSSDRAVS